MSGVNLIKLTAILVISLVVMGSANCEEGSLDVLNTEDQNISTWYEGWADEPIEATIQIEAGKAVIEGKSQNRAFGSIHKTITVDLNEYPVLEIEVESVKFYWYLIVSGEQFKFDPANPALRDGYVLVQEAANKTGKYKYNIKEISGLSGEQKFDLQVGVGKHVGGSNIGCKVVVKSLKFIRGK